jgi:hypothetical protein
MDGVPRFHAPRSSLPRAIDGVLGASPHSIPKRVHLDCVGDSCTSEEVPLMKFAIQALGCLLRQVV